MMGCASFMMILFLAAIGHLFYSAINKQAPSQKNTYIPSQPPLDSEASIKNSKTQTCKWEISIEEFEQKNLS